MARVIVPEAEAILDREFPVLDHGFLRLVDYLGGDERIVAAARVSYGPGTESVREDKALIHYLMRNLHTSPFEQVILTFHAKMPIFVARQWVRHRTARLNEVSGRYSVMPDEFYLPAVGQIRKQSKPNKEGRAPEELPRHVQERALEILKRDQASAYASYEELLRDDIARELARINVPVSAYTQWYWQIDLHNLFHFLRLRLDRHAQYEIRRYGEVMAQMAKAVAPVAFEAFEEHVLYAPRLSKSFKERLQALLRSLAASSPEAADILRELDQ
jgi:thymidylate synthase (FAD)